MTKGAGTVAVVTIYGAQCRCCGAAILSGSCPANYRYVAPICSSPRRGETRTQSERRVAAFTAMNLRLAD